MIAATKTGDLAAPPHTRGWTPITALSETRTMGSPAHAGMDPAKANVSPSIVRLPRTRGDAGSPAHAGMDPIAAPRFSP